MASEPGDFAMSNDAIAFEKYPCDSTEGKVLTIYSLGAPDQPSIYSLPASSKLQNIIFTANDQLVLGLENEIRFIQGSTFNNMHTIQIPSGISGFLVFGIN